MLIVLNKLKSGTGHNPNIKKMKSSKELLKELVESYSSSQHKGDTLINKNFIEGINLFLDSLDNGSIFRYTLDEISFCGWKDRNSVTVVINGAKGQAFTKNEKFSITFEENCNATIISKYTNRRFRFDGGRMQQEIIINLISFNREILYIKGQMSEIFEKVSEGVKNLLDGTELQIKWCDSDNSKLMISDKEGNDFFLIKGERLKDDGKMMVVGKACEMFDWEPTEKAYNQKCGDLDVLDIFMNTNDLCNKIANK